MNVLRRCAATAVLLLAAAPAGAGHSRHPYFDGGQSADGRYVVTVARIEQPAAKKGANDFHWKYIWKDTKSNKTLEGRLDGYRSGQSAVFEPVHGHVFVAPGGATFAVWNPNVVAPTRPTNAKWPDLTSPEARAWEGFTHRLTVYRKTGEVVKRLDLKDFLTDEDWRWLFCYGRQVYWQASYPGLTRDNAPRVGYALYRVSPDFTVLETLVGATPEAALKAKARGVTPPAPRAVRVDLTTGKLLDLDENVADPNKVPVRPLRGEPITKGGRGGMKDYVPSLDPIRVEGKFLEAEPKRDRP